MLVSHLVDALSPVNYKKIASELRETFVNRYIVERTSKAEKKKEKKKPPEKQSEKAETWRENLWNEIQLKGP